MYYLGFDVGGSRLKAVLVKNRKILKSTRIESPRNLPDLIDCIKKIKSELSVGIEPKQISGVGFSFPGVIDSERRRILRSPNISYLNRQPIKMILERALQRPVKIEHDAHSFLLAEKKVGAAKYLKNVFYLTLGTGIGGAFMIDGRIIFGHRGAAGEAGHMVLDLNQGLDLEDLGANKFIRRKLGIGSIEAGKRATMGDRRVKSVLKETGRNLGVGIANIINIFDPEAVILAGGVARLKKFLLPGVRRGIKKFAISPEAGKIRIIVSRLNEFGGALGAALLFER